MDISLMVGVGGIIVALLSVAGAYILGSRRGKQEVVIDTLKQSIDYHEKTAKEWKELDKMYEEQKKINTSASGAITIWNSLSDPNKH